MKFEIQRKTFLKGIHKTLGIVEKKTTMPILNNVLIRTGNSKIIIAATDKEIGLVADYDAEIITQGDVTVSARKLYEMIKELQGDVVQVESNGNSRVTVTCQNVTYKIPGLPADDFPNVFDDDKVDFYYGVKCQYLKKLIHKTYHAMASDEMKKNLHGVFFETIDEGGRNRLRMVATDGHRLAIADDDMEETASLQLEKGIIIPKNGLNEIRRFIEDAPEEIMVGVCQGMCIIKTNGAMLRVSLVDAEYPDYRRVIPVEKGVIVKVDKNAILSALKRMNVISSERCCGVILTVSDGRMVLESTNPEVGEAKDEIEADHPGTEISVAYNVKYLIDAVGAIDEKEVIFEMTAEMKPGVIRPAENDDYMCMVAPLKN